MASQKTVLIGPSAEFPEGVIVARVVGGIELIFIRSSGEVRVFQDLCTHQPVKLSDFGEVQGGRLMCHAHGGLFAIEQGGSVLGGPPCEGLRSFECLESDGQVSIIV